MNEEEVNVQEQENELTDDQSEQNENERTEESEESETVTEETNNEINDIETIPSIDDFDYERNESILLLNEFEESSELIQPILDVTFTTIFPYLLPLFILFTVFIFSDQIIALIQNAIGSNGRRRR